jgi:hypothetical protein
MDFNFNVRMLLKPDAMNMVCVDAARGRSIGGVPLKGSGDTRNRSSSNSMFSAGRAFVANTPSD